MTRKRYYDEELFDFNSEPEEKTSQVTSAKIIQPQKKDNSDAIRIIYKKLLDFCHQEALLFLDRDSYGDFCEFCTSDTAYGGRHKPVKAE